MNRQRRVSCAAAGALLAFTVSAAATTTNYQGRHCRPLGSQPDFLHQLETAYVSGDDTDVYCPLIKEASTAIDSATIAVTGVGVSCTLYGTYVSGSSLAAYTETETSTMMTETLSFGGISAAPYAFVICSMPGVGTIGALSVTEL